jgi:hypothetical protein
MRLLSTFLSLFLIPLVAVMPLRAELAADGPAATTPSSSKPPQDKLLKIRLAEDPQATVEASSFAKGYAVLVTDSAGLPVADVAVAIRLPEDGPTGLFVNGERSAVAYTDATGTAKFPQVNWGSAAGMVSVRITAVKGELHAGVLVDQTVVQQMTDRTAVAAATPAPKSPAPKLQTPGTPTSVAVVQTGATPEQTAETASADPSVSVVNSGSSQGHSNKKWIILAAVAVAAGAGIALALAGKGGAAAAAAPSSGVSIGAPSINLGH